MIQRIINLIKKLFSYKFIRFIFVGVLNTIIGYGTYAIFVFFGMLYLYASILSSVLGVINSFFWNKFFTFKSRKKSISEVIKFIIVYLITLGLGTGFLYILVDKLGMNEYIAGLLNLVMNIIFGWVGHSLFSFKEKIDKSLITDIKTGMTDKAINNLKSYGVFTDNFKKYSDIKSVLICGDPSIPAPKISIVVPAYKRTELLRDVVDSCLNQKKYDDFEVVIVDDEGAGLDVETETERIIKSYNSPKILYYKNERNMGMSGNWNRCIELARGEYLTILHNDDWLQPKMLYEASKYFKGDRAVCFRKIRRFHETKTTFKRKLIKVLIGLTNAFFYLFRKRKYNLKFKHLFVIPPFFCGTFYKREKILELGGFNSEFYPEQDVIFILNYINKYGGIKVTKQLYNYRFYQNDFLNVLDGYAENWVKIRTYTQHQYGIKDRKIEIKKLMLYDIERSQVAFMFDKDIPDIYKNIKEKQTLGYKFKRFFVFIMYNLNFIMLS